MDQRTMEAIACGVATRKTEVSILFVIDGAKGLCAAISGVFGRLALIQRCQVHKERNVLDHLPSDIQSPDTLLLIVFGGLPNWGYHNYGYTPSGIGGIILIIVLILLLTGRLGF